MNKHQIWIPFEPQAKLRARINRRSGHVYTPQKTADYEKLVKAHLKINFKTKPIQGPIDLEIDFYLRTPSKKVRQMPIVKPDWDNLGKAISDAANGILWDDDKQVINVRIRKIYDWANHRVGTEVRFSEID